MKIDRDEARRIAGLAHLAFDDAGLDRMAAEMTKILGYIEVLREPNVGEAAAGESSESRPGAGRGDTRATLRDDAAASSLDRDAVQHNAPEWANGFFVVPPVIEGE